MHMTAVEQARAVRDNYGRFHYTQQRRDFTGLFVPDVRVHALAPDEQGKGIFAGRDAFVASVHVFFAGTCSSRQMHNAAFAMSRRERVATWLMEEGIVFAPEPHHETRLERRGARRVARRELRRAIPETASLG